MGNEVSFDEFVTETFIPFMYNNKLVSGTISNGIDKAVVTLDKHGLFKVRYTKLQDNIRYPVRGDNSDKG